MFRKVKKALSKFGVFKVSNKAVSLLRRVLPLILLIGLTTGGIFWVRQSLYAARIMELEKVRINGLETLTVPEVLKMTDIRKGINLLDLDLASRVKKLSGDPRIRSVSFKKVFPNRLEIRIQERRPVLQVYSEKTKLYYPIDEEGVALPGSSAETLPDLMVYQDAALSSASLTQGGRYASEHLKDVMANFETLQGDPLMDEEKINQVRVDDLGFWSFVTEDGIEFRVGNSFENLEKLENFKILLHSEVRQTLDYLDLRFQDVVVKIKTKDQLQKAVPKPVVKPAVKTVKKTAVKPVVKPVARATVKKKTPVKKR